MRIRDEIAADIPAIEAVLLAAFEQRPLRVKDGAGLAGALRFAVRAIMAVDHPVAEQVTEHHIVATLRQAGALPVSRVAEAEGRIIGHIAFSKVRISDRSNGWYGLAPLAVALDKQGQGIGGRLVRSGLERLRELGAAGCVVVGDPRYYARFGFKHIAGLKYPNVPDEYFTALAFGASVPRGNVAYHPAFPT